MIKQRISKSQFFQVTIKFKDIKNWQASSGHIEVRIGNEKLGQTFESSLTTNNLCGRYNLPITGKNDGNGITITCKSRLAGRYLSIQKKMGEAFTILELNQISYNPPPSKYSFSNLIRTKDIFTSISR